MEVLLYNSTQKHTNVCLMKYFLLFFFFVCLRSKNGIAQLRPVHCKKLASCHISQLMLNVLYYNIDIFLNNWYNIPLSNVPPP